MKFSTLIKDERILKALTVLGYETLTSIQQESIPVLLDDIDCIIQAKTGSGKTMAYALPLLEKIIVDQKEPQVLVLCPTRELVLQIKETFDHLGAYKKVKSVAIYGKQPFQFQKEDLSQRCHVVIATPGRLLDHFKEKTFDWDKIKYFVLDEADEMLSLNFYQDIQEIESYLSKPKVTCLLSATIDESIEKLAQDFMNKPLWIMQQDRNNKIIQEFIKVDTKDKMALLYQILSKELPQSCIVFANTREKIEQLDEQLRSRSISVNKIHGGMLQEERQNQLKKFKEAKFRILVSTDLMARGIDIQRVDLIINFDVPNTFWIYTHRIGRTGRMDQEGKAITFVSQEDKEKYDQIKEKLELDKDLDTIDISDNVDLSKLGKPERLLNDRSEALKKDITKLYFKAGKNKKLRPADLAGAIMSVEGIEFEDIGVIQVQDHQSYVDILNGKGMIVLKALQNKKIKNKRIRVEIAKN